MKYVRLAIISFVLLFTVVWAVSFFIPSNVRISRATEIQAPVDSLRSYLASPAGWRKWYPNLDSANDYIENGVVKGVSSIKGGASRLVLVSADAKEIKTMYLVEGRNPVLSGWAMYPAEGRGVTVQWYMDFKLKWYPWEKFASLVFEKSYGTMMEEGLSRLKRLAETPSSPR